MNTEKIVHNGFERIKIDFPYNNEIAFQLRKIPDCRWTKTYKAWHIPYTKDAFKLLKALFPELSFTQNLILPKTQTPQNTVLPVSNPQVDNGIKSGIQIYVLGRKIVLKMPKNDSDFAFVTSFRYSKWNAQNRCWNVPSYPGNLDRMKVHFKGRIELLDESGQEISAGGQTIGKAEVLVIKTITGRLKLLFGFEKKLTLAIKTIPYHTWDAKNKWWTIPYSDRFLDLIKNRCQEDKLKFIYQEEELKNNKAARITPFDIPNYRTCPDGLKIKID